MQKDPYRIYYWANGPFFLHMGVEPKIGKTIPPTMDGENNGKNPMYKWMIWGVKTHYFWFNTHIISYS